MKANTTVPRIYDLFPKPPARFTKAVSTIADSRIAADRAEHASMVFGGNSETPDAELLVEANLRKVFNITERFTVEAGENDLFVEQFEETTTFPAGTNVIVVNIAAEGEDPEYRFDLLATPMPSGGGGILKLSKAIEGGLSTGEAHIEFEPAESFFFNLDSLVSFCAKGKLNISGNNIDCKDLSSLCYISSWEENTCVIGLYNGVENLIGSGNTVLIESIEFSCFDN